MWKVIDDIDLNKFENYGFEKRFYLMDNCYKYFYFMKNDNICDAFMGFIEIDVDTRELNIGYVRNREDSEPEYIAYEIQDKIFDLIQAGLVEKVAE